jgi:pimeloyl-ACP methyl ester carboxylesterase
MGRQLVLLLCLLVTACSSVQERRSMGRELAEKAGWTWETLDGGPFLLAAAVAPGKNSPILTVYLEGDGFAYARPSQPALDPTPADPVALRLALAHPRTGAAVNVAWLARPCQYAASPRCRTAYWTSRRYAPEIVDAVNAAIDRLKERRHATKVVLVGYSGGGAIAALLAARRNDVKSIVTVAAVLDLAYWTKRDGLAALDGSLDPAAVAQSLGTTPQVHFTGGQDDVAGTDAVRSFLRRLPPGAPARLIEIPGFSHSCCWSRDWGELMRRME